ncbi:MAG: hypothetical protein FVQ78_01730 [Solirubrobacterales bacterium]|nr:hypothetical protein [Solirubrobacterales bacterium]
MNGRFAAAVIAVSGVGVLAVAALADGIGAGNTFPLVAGGLAAALFLAGLAALGRIVVLSERRRGSR